MIELLPEGLTWGVIALLAWRSIPRILEAVTVALRERATALRLAEQARLTQAEAERTEAETDRDHDKRQEREIDTLRAEVGGLRDTLREAERMATEALHAREVDHAATRERLDACERDLAKCTGEHERTKRLLDGLARELAEVKRSIGAGSSPRR